MATVAVETTKVTPPSQRSARLWCPHIWDGCNFGAWLRLLALNRFRVSWRWWWLAILITMMSVAHSVLSLIQRLWYGRRIDRTELRQQPIFILGHWRTGTTLLHELLIRDERHAFPTTYECFAPNHFLLTEYLLTRLFWFLTPTKRPMDNMAAGWDRPQEDEFALCMLGQPSPYLTIAFPNNGPIFPEYLDLEGLPTRALASWKKTFKRFLQTITYRGGKRLVLKSPPHTCRIKVLKEMFPDAIFIHIVRNPYVVFPSTVNLWKSLYERQGLQKPTFAGLEEYVFETFVRMHDKLEETRHLVDRDHFYELRYEDLVADPIGQMRTLYKHLNLGDFEAVQPQLDDYLASVAGYETNRYALTLKQREEIGQRWAAVIARYGYHDGSKSGRIKAVRA
jgi:omega-hydroxy-beta-dihydromenaquinone-9 sulfotransferase